jgi:hypothetical protein
MTFSHDTGRRSRQNTHWQHLHNILYDTPFSSKYTQTIFAREIIRHAVLVKIRLGESFTLYGTPFSLKYPFSSKYALATFAFVREIMLHWFGQNTYWKSIMTWLQQNFIKTIISNINFNKKLHGFKFFFFYLFDRPRGTSIDGSRTNKIFSLSKFVASKWYFVVKRELCFHLIYI